MADKLKWMSCGIEVECDLPIKVELHDGEDLIKRVKQVKLRGSDVTPYNFAKVSVQRMKPHNFVPPQLYVLRGNIDQLANLEIWLRENHGCELLNLSGWLELTYEDGRKASILPPIVEETPEGDVVADGMHRVYLADITRRDVSVVYISGVDQTYPYYSYALNISWWDVPMVDELTPNVKKKFYRTSNPKTLYRDFNTAFPYVGESRGVKK